MIEQAKTFWAGSSILSKGALIGIPLLLMLLTGSAVHFIESNHREKLKEANTHLQAEYNKLLGESRSYEVQAKEYKLKDAAKAQAIEQGNKNVKAIDDKIEKAVQKYESDKKNLGDCGDVADCERKLCMELRAAGFAVTCPE